MVGDQLFNVIKQLEQASKRIDKKEIMRRYKDNEWVKMAIHYAYNPFLRYHIRNVPSSVKGQGDIEFSLDAFKLLTRLTKRQTVGKAARLETFAYIKSLTPASGELFKRILDKDLSCGIGPTSINSVFPGLVPQHKVMRAWIYDRYKVAERFAISPKLDGIRAVYKNGEFFFRNGRVVEGLDHIKKRLGTTRSFDGELFVPGLGFNTASGIIRSKAKAKPNVVYSIFDCLDNPSSPFWKRFAAIPVKDYGVCHRTPHLFFSNLIDPQLTIDIYYANARANGYEGIMIKDSDAPYVFGKSDSWLKLKPFEEAEFEITGVYEGKNKYKGMLGGIYIRIGSLIDKVGGGFSDYQRDVWWHRPAKVVGKKATIKFMEYQPSGKLRHAEFKTIRWDI